MNVLHPEIPAATQASLSLREEDFCGWIGQADPGDRLEYHRGLLAVDRANSPSPSGNANRRELSAIAVRALALAEEGRLLLVQKRHGPGDYSYLAIMSTPRKRRGGVAARPLPLQTETRSATPDTVRSEMSHRLTHEEIEKSAFGPTSGNREAIQ